MVTFTNAKDLKNFLKTTQKEYKNFTITIDGNGNVAIPTMDRNNPNNKQVAASVEALVSKFYGMSYENQMENSEEFELDLIKLDKQFVQW